VAGSTASANSNHQQLEGPLRQSLVVLLLTGSLSCGGAEAPNKDQGSGFSAALGIDTAAMTKTPSGLRYEDLVRGDGAEAVEGRTAVVHYAGWLPNGEQFDNSRERNEPFNFLVGAGRVIAGWDEGVAGMKVGGRRKLVVPPNLGYGTAGAPPDIPPGATLVFDVELLDVR
jgi:FKBP-type peptidyl-prolyl cis-trans isomerase FkpA